MSKNLFWKRLSFSTAFLCVVTLVAAQEFTAGNIKYKILDTVSKTVRIIDGKSTTGNLVIPQTVVSDSKTYTVKEIGNYSFNENITLLLSTYPHRSILLGRMLSISAKR